VRAKFALHAPIDVAFIEETMGMDERIFGDGNDDRNFDDRNFDETNFEHRRVDSRPADDAGFHAEHPSHPDRTDRTTRGIRGYGARAERALEEPRNRQLLFLIGALVLATLLTLAIWQNSGTRGARRDFASARERVLEKEKEVAEARRLLAQRLAELRAVSAEADVEATKLGGVVEENVGGAIDDARLDGPPIGPSLDTPARTPANVRAPDTGADQVYYVRDEQGRFVPVDQP
jgi:hypothetical protein